MKIKWRKLIERDLEPAYEDVLGKEPLTTSYNLGPSSKLGSITLKDKSGEEKKLHIYREELTGNIYVNPDGTFDLHSINPEYVLHVLEKAGYKLDEETTQGITLTLKGDGDKHKIYILKKYSSSDDEGKEGGYTYYLLFRRVKYKEKNSPNYNHDIKGGERVKKEVEIGLYRLLTFESVRELEDHLKTFYGADVEKQVIPTGLKGPAEVILIFPTLSEYQRRNPPYRRAI